MRSYHRNVRSRKWEDRRSPGMFFLRYDLIYVRIAKTFVWHVFRLIFVNIFEFHVNFPRMNKKQVKEIVSAVFRKIDTDGSGKVSQTESDTNFGRQIWTIFWMSSAIFEQSCSILDAISLFLVLTENDIFFKKNIFCLNHIGLTRCCVRVRSSRRFSCSELKRSTWKPSLTTCSRKEIIRISNHKNVFLASKWIILVFFLTI